jgi:hypothetical protein
MKYFSFPRLSNRIWKVWLRNNDVLMKTYKVNFLPPLLEPILYLFALGFGLGSFINVIEGVSYPQFIAPALISIAVINAAFFECTYCSYVQKYYQKTFDLIITTPLSIEEVIADELLWGTTRSLIHATIMLIVIAVFGLIKLPYALLIIPFSFIAGFLFATIGMCFTAITPNINALSYPGDDELHGGSGNDFLLGDQSDDHLWGDDNDDILVGGTGDDDIDGGSGSDTFRCRSAASAIPLYNGGGDAATDCGDSIPPVSIEVTQQRNPYQE